MWEVTRDLKVAGEAIMPAAMIAEKKVKLHFTNIFCQINYYSRILESSKISQEAFGLSW